MRVGILLVPVDFVAYKKPQQMSDYLRVRKTRVMYASLDHPEHLKEGDSILGMDGVVFLPVHIPTDMKPQFNNVDRIILMC